MPNLTIDEKFDLKMSIEDRLEKFEHENFESMYLLGIFKGQILGMLAMAVTIEAIDEAEYNAFLQRADELTVVSKALLQS